MTLLKTLSTGKFEQLQQQLNFYFAHALQNKLTKKPALPAEL